MFGKKPKRKVSASRAKRISRSVHESQIGTHVVPRSHAPGTVSATPQVEFSNERKKRRAEQGVVDQVIPRTRSGETRAEYERRLSRRDYAKGEESFRKLRRIVVIAIAAAIILAVAVGVGTAVYFGSVSDKMGLGESDARASLVAQEANKPYYVLIVGEHYRSGTAYAGPDALILARIDEAAKAVTLVSIPVNLQVVLRDGDIHKIADSQLMGGDSYLISAVSSFADVPISHIVKADDAGLAKLVDGLGGVTVQVPEEVDDPSVSDIFIDKGTQTLDGEAALAFTRASNYEQGDEVRMANQRELCIALAASAFAHEGMGMVSLLDSVSDAISTDYSSFDALSVSDVLRGFEASQVYSVQVPGYVPISQSGGTSYFVHYDDDWANMMTAVDAGIDPTPATVDASFVAPGSFSITVRNGAEITGAAAQMSDLLSAGGFVVTEVGNADHYVYEETLIVYKDPLFEPAAQAVSEYLGVGRPVDSAGFYAFETNVLVILGKDWKPLV